jgi:predicted protein tyrosine phosphatase
MPLIAVSPLSRIAEVAVKMKSREMISLLAENQNFHRPGVIDPARHLKLGINDVANPARGLVHPQEEHVAAIIDFAREWDQSAPLLVHCWYGVSRSPAAALIAALAVRPDLDDEVLVHLLRAASPQASPNTRLVEIADGLLQRDGRLIGAVRSIGRGAEFAGEKPFVLTFGE